MYSDDGEQVEAKPQNFNFRKFLKGFLNAKNNDIGNWQFATFFFSHYLGEFYVDSNQNESRTSLKKTKQNKVHHFPYSSTQTVDPPAKPHPVASNMTGEL